MIRSIMPEVTSWVPRLRGHAGNVRFGLDFPKEHSPEFYLFVGRNRGRTVGGSAKMRIVHDVWTSVFVFGVKAEVHRHPFATMPKTTANDRIAPAQSKKKMNSRSLHRRASAAMMAQRLIAPAAAAGCLASGKWATQSGFSGGRTRLPDSCRTESSGNTSAQGWSRTSTKSR